MTRRKTLLIILTLVCGAVLGYDSAISKFGTGRAAIAAQEPAKAEGKEAQPPAYKHGEVLPILPPKRDPITEPDWRKVPQPKPFQVRPPKGAPNVLIVLLDQTSYSDPSTFGGPINFPTLDKLAKEGLTYTDFHVNSLCSPSRNALLTLPQSASVQHGCRGGRGDVVSG